MPEMNVTIRPVAGMNVVEGADNATVLAILTHEGAFGFSFTAEQIGVLFGHITQMAVTRSRKSADQLSSHTKGLPLPVQSIGLASGRDKTEVLLVFRLGGLDMTFVVDTSLMAETCRNFQSGVTVVPKHPTQ